MALAVLVGLGAGVGLAVALLGGSEDTTADFCRLMGGPSVHPVAYVVFLHPDASEAEAREVGDHLATLAGVEDLRFVDQAEAHQEALDLFEHDPATQDRLDRSDVPPSWRLRYDGDDLRASLSGFAAVREITDSDLRPGTRVVDVLGSVDEDGALSPFWTLDPALPDVVRASVPPDGADAAEVLAAWLGEADPGRAPDDPGPEVRAAAAALLAVAEERCGLRPHRP